MLQAKSFGEMPTQGLHAIALGCMMPGREVGHAGFPRLMHGLFRDLAADERIDPQRKRLLEIILCCTRAPSHTPYRPVRLAYRERLSLQSLGQTVLQPVKGHVRIEAAICDQSLLPAPAFNQHAHDAP